jgi:hypothetical protein
VRTFTLIIIAIVLMGIADDLERIADAIAPKPRPEAVKILPSDSTIHKLSKQFGGP